MYKELYAVWLRENDDPSLGSLPPDFYIKIAEYMHKIKNADSALDKKSVKASLLEHEAKNVQHLLKDLLDLRYRKIVKNITKNQKVPVELLTMEEAKMSQTFAQFTSDYQQLEKNLLEGNPSQITTQVPVVKIVSRPEAQPTREPHVQKSQSAPPRLTVRFLKSIPAIMGADMKSYGPFSAEDVASLPPPNAQVLVKQGLAVLVEVS